MAEVITNPAWNLVRHRSDLRTDTKRAWFYLWEQGGRRSSDIVTSPRAVGESQCACEPVVCGKRYLVTLAEHGLIELLDCGDETWTVRLLHPAGVCKRQFIDLKESELLRQVLDLAKRTGWKSFHVRPGRTKRGWNTAVQGDGVGFPDTILIHVERCRIIVAELKIRGNPPPAQIAWLAAFEAVGIEAYVFRPADWEFIERLLKGDELPKEKQMPSHDKIEAALGEVRDRLLAAINDHEWASHDGELCWPARAEAIAFLAHSLGLGEERYLWEQVEERLDEYQAASSGAEADSCHTKS